VSLAMRVVSLIGLAGRCVHDWGLAGST